MKKVTDFSSLIEARIREMNLPGGALEGLYSPISYAMQAGGKRLRPALLLAAIDAFGGDVEKGMNAALGIEMFHNFTLLHDDVMDKSDTRRGRPTVHTRWDENTAILSGDAMLTLATQLMADVEDSKLREVMRVFNDMAMRVYEGQRLDMDFEQSDDVTLDDYIRMITDKTGHLLGASARIGALIAGASESDATNMAEYGIMLGIAFQIQDDWLDVFGDSTTFGKPIGGDINNNKKSFLLLTALAGGTPEAEAIRDAMKMPAGAAKVKVVTNLYERLNISAECRKAIGHYSSMALTALKATSLSEEAREPFRLLLEKLTGRKK